MKSLVALILALMFVIAPPRPILRGEGTCTIEVFDMIPMGGGMWKVVGEETCDNRFCHVEFTYNRETKEIGAFMRFCARRP